MVRHAIRIASSMLTDKTHDHHEICERGGTMALLMINDMISSKIEFSQGFLSRTRQCSTRS